MLYIVFLLKLTPLTTAKFLSQVCRIRNEFFPDFFSQKTFLDSKHKTYYQIIVTSIKLHLLAYNKISYFAWLLLPLFYSKNTIDNRLDREIESK